MNKKLLWMWLSYGIIWILTILLFSAMGWNYDALSGYFGFLRGYIPLLVYIYIK